MNITELAATARKLAADAQAPAGQPNDVGDALTNMAMFLEQCADTASAIKSAAMCREGVNNHNTWMKTMCATRRADPVPCGGNGGTTKCPDCPKRDGLSLTAKVLA